MPWAPARRQVVEVVEVVAADAPVLGLAGVGDGSRRAGGGAHGFRAQLTALGSLAVPVQTSGLRRSGGSVECCMQELRGPSAEVRA